MKRDDRTIQTAYDNGRVSALTAPRASIDKLIRLGLLRESELSGIYVLTEHGLCAVGDPPFSSECFNWLLTPQQGCETGDSTAR